MTSFEVLRANVLVARDDERRGHLFHVGSLDLYSARARGVFCRQAAEELGLAEELVGRDTRRVLMVCEERAEEVIRAAQKPSRPEVALIELEREQAMALLQDPQLVQRVVADFAGGGCSPPLPVAATWSRRARGCGGHTHTKGKQRSKNKQNRNDDDPDEEDQKQETVNVRGGDEDESGQAVVVEQANSRERRWRARSAIHEHRTRPPARRSPSPVLPARRRRRHRGPRRPDARRRPRPALPFQER